MILWATPKSSHQCTYTCTVASKHMGVRAGERERAERVRSDTDIKTETRTPIQIHNAGGGKLIHFSPLASFVSSDSHSAAFVYYISPTVGFSGGVYWYGVGSSAVPSLRVELHWKINLISQLHLHICYQFVILIFRLINNLRGRGTKTIFIIIIINLI